MQNRVLSRALLTALLALWLFPVSPSEGAADYPRRPKLILILVIDQFRYDYLVRYRQQFVEGGFNLLLKGGANFVDCRYDYASTETGPGHASLFTGAYGNIHGIVANEWYDRSLHNAAHCVKDPNTKLLGEPGGMAAVGASPRNLMGSTIGDELRAATDFQSKVIAISLKDRAAILPGGHTANAVYWADLSTGRFVTSTYYLSTLPSWVSQFHEQAAAIKAYCGKAWQALPETPGAGGRILKEPAASGIEPCPGPELMSWITDTPFMNEVELNFAREAIKNERLGQGVTTDLLAVSLSVNDSIGHGFGPYSAEVADTTLRTDHYLAGFFADLDRLVGLNNVWMALSGDHGVAPTPRFIQEHGLGMGQYKPETVRVAVEQALSKAFGEDQWIEYAGGANIYFNLATLEAHQVDRARAEAVAVEAAVSVPGVHAAFTRSQFLTGTLPNSPVSRKAANSYNPQRSGDIFLVVRPYAVAAGETGSTHGSPWSYDAQVPLILWGSAFRPGVYAGPCQTIDLAPTLAAALGITQPSGAQGKPLTEALK